MIAMFEPIETTVARPQVRVQVDIWKMNQVALGFFPKATEPMVVDLTLEEARFLADVLLQAADFATEAP